MLYVGNSIFQSYHISDRELDSGGTFVIDVVSQQLYGRELRNLRTV